MTPNQLTECLWGDKYYKQKEKKIVLQPPTSKSKEMGIVFIFDPLVKQYKKFFDESIIGDTMKVRAANQSVKKLLEKTMPVEKAILSMVCEQLPAPV